MYINRTKGDKIKNKEKLRETLEKVSRELELIDVTIKIYDSIFFFFFMMKPKIAHIQITDSILENIKDLENWDEKYMFDGVYDLQEDYIKQYLFKLGFDYTNG